MWSVSITNTLYEDCHSSTAWKAFHLTFSSSCIRGNSKWLFTANLLQTAPQLPCYQSLQRSARRALIRNSFMTKLPYSFMTTSYDSVSWQSCDNNFQCGHLSPSRGGWAINGLMQPSRHAAPSQRCHHVQSPAPATRVIAGHCTQGSAFQTPLNKRLRNLKHAILETPVKHICSYNHPYIWRVIHKQIPLCTLKFYTHNWALMVILRSLHGCLLIWNDRSNLCKQILITWGKKPSYELFAMNWPTSSVTNRNRAEKLSIWLIVHITL